MKLQGSNLRGKAPKATVLFEEWNKTIPPLIRKSLSQREAVIQDHKKLLETPKGELALSGLRKQFDIPENLSSEEDFRIYPISSGYDETEVEVSDHLGMKFSYGLRDAVARFLAENNFDPHLEEAVWFRILYKQWPPHKQLFGTMEQLVAPLILSHSDEELKGMKLRAAEKKLLRQMARVMLGIKGGRPPKTEKGKRYKEILRRINLVKNDVRKSRNFEPTHVAAIHEGRWSPFVKKTPAGKQEQTDLERLKQRDWRLKKKHPIFKRKVES